MSSGSTSAASRASASRCRERAEPFVDEIGVRLEQGERSDVALELSERHRSASDGLGAQGLQLLVLAEPGRWHGRGVLTASGGDGERKHVVNAMDIAAFPNSKRRGITSTVFGRKFAGDDPLPRNLAAHRPLLDHAELRLPGARHVGVDGVLGETEGCCHLAGFNVCRFQSET